MLGLNNPDSGTSFMSRSTFTLQEVLKIAKDLAEALDYIHTQVHRDAMIIHRDLKPENLGLSADGRLKLFDFGLCRCVQKRTSENDAYEMTGNTGSLRYMAPEVVLNRGYNEKVDVFSFAVVMWTIAREKVHSTLMKPSCLFMQYASFHTLELHRFIYNILLLLFSNF